MARLRRQSLLTRSVREDIWQEIADNAVRLKKAGYEDPRNNRYYIHTPCGQGAPNPIRHDGVCPANNNGRTTPLLSELGDK